MNQCTKCGFENADESKFCKMCGAKLKTNVKQKACRFCGKKASEETLFCTACGNPLEESMGTKNPKIKSAWANESNTGESPNKKSGMKILLVVFVIAILIVLIGVVFAQKNAGLILKKHLPK